MTDHTRRDIGLMVIFYSCLFAWAGVTIVAGWLWNL